MKVPLVVAFPIVFFLFSDRGRHGGLLKLMKNDTFKYFLPLWPVFSRFWAGLGADHTLFYKNKQYFVAYTFSFLLGSTASVKSAET